MAPPTAPPPPARPGARQDVVLCPPESNIPVDWVRLQHALQHEVAAAVPDAAPAFAEVLLLLQLLSHIAYAGEARQLTCAMMLCKPQLSADERSILAASAQPAAGASSSSTSTSTSSTSSTSTSTSNSNSSRGQLQSGQGGPTPVPVMSEQMLLDSIVQLLLRARYTPMTREEWENAASNQFTFDIPVAINWDVLDTQLLTQFWQRQETKHPGSCDAADSAAAGPSSSMADSGSTDWFVHPWAEEAQKPLPSDTHHQQQQQQQGQAAMPPREALPAFSDRLLVFHRGAGVATAPGLYLNQKLDLLFDYLAVQPVAAAASALARALGINPGQQPQPQQQQQQQELRSWWPEQQDSSEKRGGAGSSSSSSSNGSNNGSSSGVRVYSLSSGSPSGGHHPTRVVVRRSLRSLLPTPTHVLAAFWQPLVLQEPTLTSVVVLYRAAAAPGTVQAGGAPGSNPAESAITATLSAAAGDVFAADVAVVAARADASAAPTVTRAAKRSLAAGRAARAAAREAAAAVRLQDNPHNIILKSFADVAVADLELVMPSKQVQVTPSTLVRSVLLAAGALAALAALIEQGAAESWQPSLLVAPAVGLVAARAIKLLTTIKSHQASLTSRMLTMAYNASRDSQEGVLVKLVDDLRDSHAKEAALVVAVLLTNNSPRWCRAAAASSSSSSSSSSTDGASAPQIEAACEAFLQQRFGVQVDLALEDTLGLLLQWGLVEQLGDASYSLIPLPEALERLRAQSLLAHQASTLQRHGTFAPPALGPSAEEESGRWASCRQPQAARQDAAARRPPPQVAAAAAARSRSGVGGGSSSSGAGGRPPLGRSVPRAQAASSSDALRRGQHLLPRLVGLPPRHCRPASAAAPARAAWRVPL